MADDPLLAIESTIPWFELDRSKNRKDRHPMPAELTPAEALAYLRKEIVDGRRYSYVSPATANRLETIADALAAAVEDAERNQNPSPRRATVSLTKEEIIEAVARGWCHLPDRVMDRPLALFIAGEVQAALAAAQPKAPSPTPGEVERALAYIQDAGGDRWPDLEWSDEGNRHLATLRAALPAQGWRRELNDLRALMQQDGVGYDDLRWHVEQLLASVPTPPNAEPKS